MRANWLVYLGNNTVPADKKVRSSFRVWSSSTGVFADVRCRKSKIFHFRSIAALPADVVMSTRDLDALWIRRRRNGLSVDLLGTGRCRGSLAGTAAQINSFGGVRSGPHSEIFSSNYLTRRTQGTFHVKLLSNHARVRVDRGVERLVAVGLGSELINSPAPRIRPASFLEQDRDRAQEPILA